MTRMRSYHVMDDGSLREGALVDVVAPTAVSGGISIRYEDAAGKTLALSGAVYRRFDSLPGGIVLGPEPPSGAIRARVEGLAVRSVALRHR